MSISVKTITKPLVCTFLCDFLKIVYWVLWQVSHFSGPIIYESKNNKESHSQLLSFSFLSVDNV